MKNIFLGRQPILDREHNLVAYELLFRNSQDNWAQITNDVHASASVVVNAYGQMGIRQVLGDLRGFINVSQELLLNDAILLLPSSHVVLELLETITVTPEIVQRCAELKEAGYRLALDDVTQINSRIESLLPLVDIVKVDVLALSDVEIEQIMHTLKTWPVVPLAEKVNSLGRAELCKKLGFEMFQGHFFAKPEIMSGKQIKPSKLTLLELLMLIVREDEIDSIEQVLKREPGLSYNLLRIVNSVAAALSQKIGSIRQAVMVMGYQQLQRWVQLLLYAVGPVDNASGVNALLQTAAIRGKLMELIAMIDRPHDKNYQDRAFMVGIMSLLDVLFGMDMQKVLEKLQIPDEIVRALLHREGSLGWKLQLVEASEKEDVDLMNDMMSRLTFLDQPSLIQAELNALEWATHIHQTANPID